MILRRAAASLALGLVVSAFFVLPSCSGKCNQEGCPCDYDEECERTDLPSCQKMICSDEQQVCVLGLYLEGFPCEGGVCDGYGACVECTRGRDCELGQKCEPGNVCSRCDDGVLNGYETGLDCGGMCKLCPGKCYTDADCGPPGGYCYQGFCARCDDGIKNGDEWKTDCRFYQGNHCALCIGMECAADEDCASGICAQNGICCLTPCSGCYHCNYSGECIPILANFNGSPKCPPGQACNGEGQCALYSGQPCTMDEQCAAHYCDNGKCK